MKNATAIMLICLGLANLVGGNTAPRRTRHHNKRSAESQLAQDWSLVNSWACGTPRPRLVYRDESLSAIDPSLLEPNKDWRLLAAVLHRCEPALGCCPQGKSCSMSESTVVSKTFVVVEKVSGRSFRPVLQFSNHTRCSCT